MKLSDLKIFVGIPSHDGRIECNTTRALLQATMECKELGLRWPQFSFLLQESILPHARNLCLAQFLASDCSDLVFIDADMDWEPIAFPKLFIHDVDIVGASYRKKMPQVQYSIEWLPGEQDSDPETGLLEVASLPMGFCRIQRRTLEQMIDRLKPDFYPANFGQGELRVPLLFENEFRDGRFWGEDYTFCRKAREAGLKVWVNPDMSITHHGSAAYPGHLGDFVRQMQSEQEKKEAA